MESYSRNKPNKQIPNYRQISPTEYYYCTKCQEIPQIIMEENAKINVMCKCESILLSLDQYFERIAGNKRKIPIYCYNFHLPIKEAVAYCDQCQKYYCRDCLNIHLKEGEKGHSVTLGSEFKLNALCQNENCEFKEKYYYYCLTCSKYFCPRCKYEHAEKIKSHKIIDLVSFFQKKHLNDFIQGIKNAQLRLRNEEEDLENTINSLEKVLKSWRERLEIKRKENSQLIQFFESLVSTYNSSKEILNYNIRNNILINDIEKITNNRLEVFLKKLQSDYDKHEHPELLKLEINYKKLSMKKGEIFLKQKVKISEAELNNEETILNGSFAITDLVISHSGKLCCGCYNPIIFIYSYEDGKFKYENYLHYGYDPEINSPNNNILFVNRIFKAQKYDHIFSLANNNSMKLWNLITYQCVSVYQIEKSQEIARQIEGIFLTNSNDIITYGYEDGSFKIRDEEGQLENTVFGHGARITSMVELEDSTLVTVGWNGKINFWHIVNLTSKEYNLEDNFINLNCHFILTIQYQPRNNMLVVGGFILITIIDLDARVVEKTLDLSQDIYELGKYLILPSGDLIASLLSIEFNDYSKLVKSDKNNILLETETPFNVSIGAMIYFKNNKFICGDYKGNIMIWEY